MAMIDTDETMEKKAVFIDTNLDTNLAIPVSFGDTVFELKRKMQSEHSKCFPKFGEIEIHALKVRRKKKEYYLSDMMPVGIVFGGVASRWFLSADISSPLQRQRMKHGRSLNLSSDAGSGNLQMVVHINNDDNLKSSSSDTHKRLNPNVDGTLNASSEKDAVPVVDSRRTSRFSGLVAEVISVNPNKESLNKLKRKKKTTAYARGSGGADVVEVGNILAGVNHDKQGDESLEIGLLQPSSLDLKNSVFLEVDKAVDPQGEGDMIFESQNMDMLVKRSNKTKLTGKKNVKRKKKDEVANDVLSRDIDASIKGGSLINFEKSTVNDQHIGISPNDVRRSIFPDDFLLSNPQTTEKLDSSSGTNINMDEDKTEDLGKFERALDARDVEMETKIVQEVPGSRAKKSKKRKKNENVAPNQTDAAKGDGNLDVPDIGEIEGETMRPKKRKKIWDDVLDVVKMVGLVDKEPGEPITGDDDRKSEAIGVALTSEVKRANKRKNNEFDFDAPARHFPFVGEPDKLKLDELVGPGRIQTVQGDTDGKEQQLQASSNDDTEAKQLELSHLSIATKSAGRKQKAARVKNSKIEVKMREINTEIEEMRDEEKLGMPPSVFSTSGFGEEGNISQNDTELRKPIQNQKSKGDTGSESKMNKKKARQKKTSALINISEFPVKDQNLSMKPETSESTRPPKSEALQDDVNESSSSHPEHTYKGNTVVNKDVMDNSVICTNHGSDNAPLQVANDMNHTDANSIQRTQIQKSDDGGKSKRKRSGKSKQKQGLAVKGIPELPANDENNIMKYDSGDSTRTKKAADEDNEVGPSSAFQERIDKVDSVISAVAPDTKIVEGGVQGEALIPQIEANETGKNDVDPIQKTQIKKSKSKKKTKQNGIIKVERSKSTCSISEAEKGTEMESLSSPVINFLNGSKNTGEERAFLDRPDPRESTNVGQRERPVVLSGAKRSNDDSEPSSAESDHGKSKKQLPKMEQCSSGPPKSSSKSIGKVDQTPSAKRSLIPKSGSIFKDVSSSSSEDKDGENSDSSTESPNHRSSSDSSKGNSKEDGGVNSLSRAKAPEEQKNNAEAVQLTQTHKSKQNDGDKSKPKRKTEQNSIIGKVEMESLSSPVQNFLNGSKNTEESTGAGQRERPVVLSGAKRSNDGSETSSAISDQDKAKKQLPKMGQCSSGLAGQCSSGLAKSSGKSIGKVAQTPSAKRSLISKSGSIFKDVSSSSSEGKDGGDSDSSTETPNHHSSSSDSSEGESRGSWMSPRRGNSKDDEGVNSLSQSKPSKLPLASILRSSHKYKKAKVIASQLQLEEDESQPVDFVPDSQADV